MREAWEGWELRGGGAKARRGQASVPWGKPERTEAEGTLAGTGRNWGLPEFEGRFSSEAGWRDLPPVWLGNAHLSHKPRVPSSAPLQDPRHLGPAALPISLAGTQHSALSSTQHSARLPWSEARTQSRRRGVAQPKGPRKPGASSSGSKTPQGPPAS